MIDRGCGDAGFRVLFKLFFSDLSMTKTCIQKFVYGLKMRFLAFYQRWLDVKRPVCFFYDEILNGDAGIRLLFKIFFYNCLAIKRRRVYKKSMDGPAKKDFEPPIMLKDIIAMGHKRLRDICSENDLRTDGTKKDLAKRVKIKFHGSDRFRPNNIRCRYCQHKALVKSTETTYRPDGSAIIIRRLRCTGKHAHTYKLVEETN